MADDETGVFVFDAYGTLFDVHSAVGRLRDRIGADADRLSTIWRDKQLQYTWVRSLCGRMKPFHDVTADALDFAMSSVELNDPDLRDRLLDAYMSLSPYGEVVEVLRTLKEREKKLAILSNGSTRMLDAAVTSAGLEGVFDAVLSVDDVGIYKPDMKVYALATNYFERNARNIAFQSSNRWDIAGATAFGFVTTWVNRFDQPDEFHDMAPTRTARDLRVLID